MATTMSTMSHNYNVYVSAIYSGSKENKSLSTSSFSVKLIVSSSYVSDVTVSMEKKVFHTWESFNRAKSVTREIKNHSKQQSFLFLCHSLSWDFVSKMVSDMNIPFSLDKLQWRSSPKENWISLGKQDDVISSILSLARSKADTISTNDVHPKELGFHLSIKKEIVLPHLEFEAMVNARRLEELSHNINQAISWANQQPPSLRRLYLRDLRATSEYKSFQSVIEQAIRESAEQEESKPIPTAKAAIEALEDLIFDSNDSTNSWCAICREKLEIGCSVTGMPCSHKFHKTCIVSCLNTSHTCPLCRFQLPTL